MDTIWTPEFNPQTLGKRIKETTKVIDDIIGRNGKKNLEIHINFK